MHTYNNTLLKYLKSLISQVTKLSPEYLLLLCSYQCLPCPLNGAHPTPSPSRHCPLIMELYSQCMEILFLPILLSDPNLHRCRKPCLQSEAEWEKSAQVCLYVSSWTGNPQDHCVVQFSNDLCSPEFPFTFAFTLRTRTSPFSLSICMPSSKHRIALL